MKLQDMSLPVAKRMGWAALALFATLSSIFVVKSVFLTILMLAFGVYEGIMGYGQYIQEKEQAETESRYSAEWTAAFEKAKPTIGYTTIGLYNMWVSNGCLNWFSRRIYERPYKTVSVPLDRVLYYKQYGDLYTSVSGSGGQSSFSIITGFHGKIEPIKISTEVKDNRSTQLFYDDGEKDCILVFPYDGFTLLKRLIPDKDYAVVEALRIETLKKTMSAESLEAKLTTLDELRKANIISETEYASKRSEVLSEF